MIQKQIHARDEEYDFVNFVCPHCGLGTVHQVKNLERRPALSVPRLIRPPLYCALLECDDPNCSARLLIHTTARGADQNGKPHREVTTWNVEALRCLNGHPAKAPVKLQNGHVFASEGT
jgi:hypothetical protein